MRSRFTSPMILTLFSMLILCGCSSGSARVDGGTGSLQIHLTDAPIDMSDVQSVNVTLTGVVVFPRDDNDPMALVSDGRPITLMSHPATFDLLTLTGGATALLASGMVPSGDYSRIRLEISDATLVYDDGGSVALKIESQKVDIPIGFHVNTGGQTGLILDFDAAASVQVNETGPDRFILRPVVTPVR